MVEARGIWTPKANGLSRRQLLGLGLGGALGVSLAGCGGGDNGSSGPTGTSTPSGSSSAAPSLAAPPVDGPTLRIWADGEFVPRMVEASRPFTDQYQVNLEFQPFSFVDIQTQFTQAAPGGNGPDIIDAAVDWIAGFNQAALLAPLTFPGDTASSFDERALTGMTVGESTYGLPITVESINLWRNTELVPEPVTTWDQMAQVAEQLKAQGVEYPFILENDPTNGYLFIGMLTAFGGYCFAQRPDGSYDINDTGLDTAGAVASLAWLDQAVKNGWTQNGITTDVATAAFTDGAAGVELAGPWRLQTYEESGVPYAIDPLPAGPAGPARPWLGVRGFMVNAKSPQVALAQTFLTEYWATDEPMKMFAESTGKESAWGPVKQEAATPAVKAFTAAAENAQIIPTDPALAGYWPAIAGAMDLVFQQDASPEEAMAQAAEQLQAAVDD